MNAKERRQLSYLPAAALDAAINKRYPGVKAETTYNFFADRHQTTFSPTKPRGKALVKSARAFTEGYTAGLLELRERLENKDKWL